MSRKMVIYTGITGMQEIDKAIYKEAIIVPAIKRAAGLLAKDLITDQQYENLCSMIASPDRENILVANTIMDAKESNQNENTLQSRRPQLYKHRSNG